MISKKIKRVVVVFSILGMLLGNNLFAQLSKANTYFTQEKYADAIVYYNKTLKKDQNNIEAVQNIAYSYRKLKDYVNAEGNFYINQNKVKLTGKNILIVATDGCFGYFPSPVHFEYSLLKTLSESTSIDTWQKKLTQDIVYITKDDATMSLPSFFRLSKVSSVFPPLLFRLNSVESLYLSRDSKLLFK